MIPPGDIGPAAAPPPPPSRSVRLGIIYPPGGGDQEYYQFAEATGDVVRILLVTTLLCWGDERSHDVDALLKVGNVAQLASAARKLRDLAPDSVMWACTSASFVGGVAWAEEQVRAIADACGRPAGGTSLAFVGALEALGVDRVAVMATYPEVVAERFVRFLGDRGIRVTNMVSLDQISGWEAAQIPSGEVMDAVRRADRGDAGAVLIPDTAIATLPLIDPLERELGKPVLTANQVTLWDGLRLAESGMRPRGWGRLLAA